MAHTQRSGCVPGAPGAAKSASLTASLTADDATAIFAPTPTANDATTICT